MRQLITHVFAITLSCISCQIDNEQETGPPHRAPTLGDPLGTKDERPIDREPERNDPDALDLSEQQLFVDTTGESQFYDEYYSWEEGQAERKIIRKTLDEMEESFTLTEANLGDFPSDWIIVRQFKDQYILNNLRPGIRGNRYRVTNNAVTFYRQGQSMRVHAIDSLEKLTSNEISMKIIVPADVSRYRYADFSIRPTHMDFIYLLSCQYDNHIIKELVTPLDKIHHFEMMVHYNNGELIWNPVQMEEINFTEIEYELPVSND